MSETSVLSSQLKEIGNRLKLSRKSKEKTQKEMANLCGLTMSAISEMESGLKKPHSSYVFILANSFNVNLNWIFTGRGPMNIPEIESKYDFGPDSERIAEMIHSMENSEFIRFQMLAYFIRAKREHENTFENNKQ